MKNIVNSNHKLPDQNAHIVTLQQQIATLIAHAKVQSQIIDNFQDLERKFEQLVKESAEREKKFEEMKVHYEWLKRQMHGKKSERYIPDTLGEQDDLFGFAEDDANKDKPSEKEIASHTRKVRNKQSSKVTFGDKVTEITEVLDIPEEDNERTKSVL